jgi:protein-S-isoprenylcysteine O-methyltransferase Ste14
MMSLEAEKSESTYGLNKDIIRRMFQVFALLVFTAVILFISAGTLGWTWGWIYIIIYLIYIMINASILPKELIAERGKSKDNVKKWDKTINKINTIQGIGLIVISGLDTRFKWTSESSIYIHIIGLVMYITGSIIFSWSMVSNKFFSTLVRIQMDRDHKVAESGPYRFVRHPGYSGFILSSLGVPLLLGSLWALIPAVITGILFILRTIFEDKTLFNELGGYKNYSERTRYKLVPWIW